MRLLKNVASADKPRQKMMKNRSIYVICEDFETFFNAGLSSVVVLQEPHHV